MGHVTVRPGQPQTAIFVIPLTELLQGDPLFELGVAHDFSRNELINAVIGIADGLLGNDISYPQCGEYFESLHKTVPPNDLVDCVLGIAERLVRRLPIRAQELLYLRTCHHNLYLKVTLQP